MKQFKDFIIGLFMGVVIVPWMLFLSGLQFLYYFKDEWDDCSSKALYGKRNVWEERMWLVGITLMLVVVNVVCWIKAVRLISSLW